MSLNPKRRFLRALALLVGITACISVSPAVAGPPFKTDDPEPTDFRNWEIYAGSEYENGNGGVVAALPFAEFNFGALPNVQVTIAASGEYTATSSTHHYAYGGTDFGVKYRFVQESDNRPQIAFAPQISIPATAGDHAIPFLPIWLEKNWGPWTAYGGGGLYLNSGEGNRNFTYIGGVLKRPISPVTTLGVEFYGQSPDTVDATYTTGTTIGLTTQLGEYHAILFSIGRAFNSNNTFSAYASYKWALGPKASKEESK
jgi:hypothetical protein